MDGAAGREGSWRPRWRRAALTDAVDVDAAGDAASGSRASSASSASMLAVAFADAVVRIATPPVSARILLFRCCCARTGAPLPRAWPNGISRASASAAAARGGRLTSRVAAQAACVRGARTGTRISSFPSIANSCRPCARLAHVADGGVHAQEICVSATCYRSRLCKSRRTALTPSRCWMSIFVIAGGRLADRGNRAHPAAPPCGRCAGAAVSR